MTYPSRREPVLDAVHAPLRADVSFLGKVLGQVIREQAGIDIYEKVEEARAAAIERRSAEGAPDSLGTLLSGLEPAIARSLVQAFSTYFSLTNLAEQVHRIRRRRDYQFGERPQPGSVEAVFNQFDEVKNSRLAEVLGQVQVVPVFTSHPTEATRRTILKKEQRIARVLVDRIEQTQPTPREERRFAERIRSEIGLIWQTAEQASVRPSVSDEVEHVLFFLSEVIYRVIPAFQEAVQEAYFGLLPTDALPEFPCPMVRFASWVGGDMDGNPNVGAETFLATLARQREVIIGKYRQEVRDLFEHLSQSQTRVEFRPLLMERAAWYEERFPETAAQIPGRYRDMPYRILSWFIWARLGLTLEDDSKGYSSPEEFRSDLEIIDASLAENRGEHAGQHLVRRLLVRVKTFGFHLATLDLRQDSEVHRRVLEGSHDKDESLRVLAVFRAIGEARRRFGAEAVGPYIISMASGAEDVLAVLTLAGRAGLAQQGRIPLDVVPLFETVGDLERADLILEDMLKSVEYREHVRCRGNRQMIMLGYSDSAKISGVGASRWALYRAQEKLVSAAGRLGVDLTLFHGRGGTMARGGSKPRSAILAEPPGTLQARLRTTEQGEIINSKYGLRGIAERTLELTFGAVLEATLEESGGRELPSEWRAVMGTVSEYSQRAWRKLVHDDPRFMPYFLSATPIEVIQRLPMGSRPSSRRSGAGLENLRAIPWVFAWTQSRHLLPGWYGLGDGLRQAIERHGIGVLREMANGWRFFENLLSDAEMTLAKADMKIAEYYSGLASTEERSLFGEILQAYHSTCETLLMVRGEEQLLSREPVLKELIRLRNPYVDPMSIIQVDLLRRWRDSGRRDDDLLGLLFETVRGIARGLRNTG